MNFLLNFTTNLAIGLSYLIPAFCYGGALVLVIMAAVAIYEAGRNPRGGAGQYFRILLMVVTASLLLSYPTVVNLFSATLGGSATVNVTGGLAYTQASVISGGTLQDTILSLVQAFGPALRAIGGLAILLGIMKMREIGSGSGHPLTNCAVRFVCGAILLNSQTIAATLLGGP